MSGQRTETPDNLVGSVPHWFEEEVRAAARSLAKPGQGSAFEGVASSSLEQIYRTRSDFRDEMGAFTTLVIATFTAAGVLLNQGLSTLKGVEQPSDRQIAAIYFLLAGGVFLSAIFLGRLFRSRLSAAYDIYVSACIHSTIVFRSLGFPLTQIWQQNVEECLRFAHGTYPKRQPIELSHCAWQWHRDFKSSRTNGSLPKGYGELVAAWRSRYPNLWTKLRHTVITVQVSAIVLCVLSAALLVYSLFG